jgi:hypothetical protein
MKNTKIINKAPIKSTLFTNNLTSVKSNNITSAKSNNITPVKSNNLTPVKSNNIKTLLISNKTKQPVLQKKSTFQKNSQKLVNKSLISNNVFLLLKNKRK